MTKATPLKDSLTEGEISALQNVMLNEPLSMTNPTGSMKTLVDKGYVIYDAKQRKVRVCWPRIPRPKAKRKYHSVRK